MALAAFCAIMMTVSAAPQSRNQTYLQGDSFYFQQKFDKGNVNIIILPGQTPQTKRVIVKYENQPIDLEANFEYHQEVKVSGTSYVLLYQAEGWRNNIKELKIPSSMKEHLKDAKLTVESVKAEGGVGEREYTARLTLSFNYIGFKVTVKDAVKHNFVEEKR